MIRLFLSVLMICSACHIYGQLTENFSDGDILSNPVWLGNTNHFIVNSSLQLQLNAPLAGESYIYTKYKLPEDSIMVDFYFKMTFEPSDNNQSRIYLFLDDPDESKANGYYLRLGENGTNDAIRVIKLVNGVSTIIASGSLAAIARDPAQGRVQIRITGDGIWELLVDYNGGMLYVTDLEFAENMLNLPDSVYFGIKCRYTSTRLSHFFFDDITVKTIEKDTLPPTIISADVLDEFRLSVRFSEIPEESSMRRLSSYSVDNGLGNPVQIIIENNAPNIAILHFTSAMRSGTTYKLTVQGVADRVGNTGIQTISFVFPVLAQKGDLVISEVLTDPYAGGEDFVEIFNASENFIKLNGLIIRNSSNNQTRTLVTEMILLPGEYVALSANVDFLKNTYETPSNAKFISSTLPALNVADANITLLVSRPQGNVVIDSFDYFRSYHYSLIDNTKGVSLERINLKGPSNDPNNWHSASQQVKFATPGYVNSNLKSNINSVEDDAIQLSTKVFSPNSDGFEDFLLIHYEVEKSGYLATIKIFDAEGFPVRDLVNNYLLGSEGAIKWDGLDDEGRVGKVGMYIIQVRLFHTDGINRVFRKVAVLADNL